MANKAKLENWEKKIVAPKRGRPAKTQVQAAPVKRTYRKRKAGLNREAQSEVITIQVPAQLSFRFPSSLRLG